jgi:MYXO-CTERM domain-containing protein
VNRRVLLLTTLLIVGALAVLAHPVAANHWCSPTPPTVGVSPLFGYAGDTVNVGVTITNSIADALNVLYIHVVFQWSTTTWNWGTMSLPGYGSSTNTYSVQLPSAPADYTVSISISGQAVGDFGSSVCGPFTGVFRVASLPPPPTVSASANPTTGTSPLTVAFSASVSNGLAPFGYAWSFGDGATDTSGPSVYHGYSAAGTYNAQIVVTDSRGRTASGTATVTVTAAIPPLAATAAADVTSGTIPFAVTLGASGSGGVAPYTYSWTFGDGGTSTQQNPAHTFQVAGTYSVSVVVTDSRGNSVTKTVTVTASPSPVLGSGTGIPPWVIYIVLAVAAALLGVALVVRRRRRRVPPPMPPQVPQPPGR